MQTDVVFTGIGGQGVLLAARIVCLGAMRAGQHVRFTSEVGGEMRGGASMAMISVGDAPLRSMPIVVAADVAVVIHGKHWGQADPRVRPDAVVLANSTLCTPGLFGDSRTVHSLPATDMAQEAGAPMTVALVMAGAFIEQTGLVPLADVEQAMEDMLPAYRRQHAPANRAALRAGAAAIASARAGVVA